MSAYLLALVALANGDQSDVLQHMNWKAVYTLQGKCSRLVTPERDYSSLCSGTLFHMEYRDGRLSYSFPARGTALISFSGFTSNEAPRLSVMSVDHMTVTTGTEKAPKAVASTATGTCTLTVPNLDHFEVKCTAHSQAGDYSGSFTSDGSRPERIDF